MSRRETILAMEGVVTADRVAAELLIPESSARVILSVMTKELQLERIGVGQYWNGKGEYPDTEYVHKRVAKFRNYTAEELRYSIADELEADPSMTFYDIMRMCEVRGVAKNRVLCALYPCKVVIPTDFVPTID